VGENVQEKLTSLEVAYYRMAQDDAREAQAMEWAEATVGDVANETN